MKRPFRRFAPLATFALAAGLIGCGAQPGDTLVQYERGDTGDVLVPSPGNGRAALYSGNDLNPSVRVPVERGDEVGFRDDRTEAGAGSVRAVAGDFEREIEQGAIFDREYYWKFQQDEE